MLWELDALKILARNQTVPGIALRDTIKEIERLQEALNTALSEGDRLQHEMDKAREKLSSSAGYKNLTLVRALLAALDIADVPIEGQLQAALDAVKALKCERKP